MGDPRTALIVRASESIRIVREVKDKDPPFDAARAALENARVVFFLGFGFGLDNVRRLGLSHISSDANVYATRTQIVNDGVKPRDFGDGARFWAGGGVVELVLDVARVRTADRSAGYRWVAAAMTVGRARVRSAGAARRNDARVLR